MKKTVISLAIASLLILHSCQKNIESEAQNQPKSVEGAELGYDASSTKLIWTAFKTTDKVGVNGNFAKFKIEGTKKAKSVIDVFKNASILIDAKSVNTGNKLRDSRIVNSYFGVFVNTDYIYAKILNLNTQKGLLAITLNDITNKIPVQVSLDRKEIKLKGVIDVNLFNGQQATDSLNKVCEDVHKGADGITKLWPDVEIMIKTTVK